MSSSSSSLQRSSPHSSQSHAIATSNSNLESLIPHLLASKRSLASISHVYRANELCSSTRLALAHSATVTARTSFLRRGNIAQFSILEELQHSVVNAAKDVKEEFEAVVRDLDEANTRLRGTLESLKATIIEAGLRPEAEGRRSLLDFVDESGVDRLVGTIKAVIDGAGQSIKNFEGANRELMEEAGHITHALDGGGRPSSLDLHPENSLSLLPDLLHEMEGYAKHMARELEGLVTHYDMCVAAIKHTEGGGDAAVKVTNDLLEGAEIGRDVSGPPEPIDEEQQREMLRVIQEDSGQVEGAVVDICNLLIEMETLHERAQMYVDQSANNRDSMIAAFKLLDAIGGKLHSYVTKCQAFLLRWESDKAKIDEQLEELEGLTQFYDGFLRAYDNMLIEIGRRKAMEMRVEKEVETAKTHLEKLYEDDVEAREAFRKEHGEFLPVDIWPGLMAGPLRFEIVPIDEEMTRVPDVSNSVIHRAIKRVRGER